MKNEETQSQEDARMNYLHRGKMQLQYQQITEKENQLAEATEDCTGLCDRIWKGI